MFDIKSNHVYTEKLCFCSHPPLKKPKTKTKQYPHTKRPTNTWDKITNETAKSFSHRVLKGTACRVILMNVYTKFYNYTLYGNNCIF